MSACGVMADKFKGKRMERVRIAAGFASANALAEKMGVPASTITRWENGERVPRTNELYRLSRVLNVSCETFCLNIGDPVTFRDGTVVG
jgi:transcriptional regulator with XRE-family HTH domain